MTTLSEIISGTARIANLKKIDINAITLAIDRDFANFSGNN